MSKYHVQKKGNDKYKEKKNVDPSSGVNFHTISESFITFKGTSPKLLMTVDIQI